MDSNENVDDRVDDATLGSNGSTNVGDRSERMRVTYRTYDNGGSGSDDVN